MACSPDFVQYIIDQCSGAGEIAVNSNLQYDARTVSFLAFGSAFHHAQV